MTTVSKSIGRPRVTATREDVLRLRGERYNWKEVAAILGIGRATAVRLVSTPKAHQAWNVYLNGKLKDTVFYQPDCDAEYVRKGLIDHDGYDSAITVKRCNRY